MLIARQFAPWSNLRQMQNRLRYMQNEMSRLFEGYDGKKDDEAFPALNVFEKGQDIVITAELAGIAPDDLSITVTGNTLTIQGNRKPLELDEGSSYHRRERWSGEFTRTVELPFVVNSEKVEAKYEKGVLYLELPRAESEKAIKIEIK
ncbi:heat shock protein Hsp20 family protein [Candidatus Magnetoovum chiemensis]|nr:heat shock protein Hsp20 family protein [Candidatus Magnetoovum chiemensis]